MTKRHVYIGSVGPLIYDDADTYGDGIGQRGIRTEAIYLDSAPSNDSEAPRRQDVGDLAISALQSQPFVVASLSGDLTSERVLTAGTGISITDNGANGTIVVSATAGIKIGSFTRDLTAASGDASITGVGFKPSNVIFISGWNYNSFAVGFDNGTSAFHGVTVAGSCFVYSAASIRFVTFGGADATHGKIKSLDSDGFTVTYTLSNSQSGQTGTLYYIAFR